MSMEERLRRSEYEAVRCLLGAVSYAAHARDDLQARLGEDGGRKMSEILDGLRGVAADLLKTVPDGQCRTDSAGSCGTR